MSAHSSDKKLSIQVLDDNPFYATFLEHQLKQYFAAHFPEFSDIVISSFTHNADYLDALPETVSISLIDFYLEDGVTGIDLLPEIKKRSAACRVIIMTTENNLEALANCLDTNVASYSRTRALYRCAIPSLSVRSSGCRTRRGKHDIVAT